MGSVLKRRPSAALVIAFIALFVALSGVGYTAAKLNGKRLKNRSVAARKIKKNSLGATEINKAKLGKVLDSEKLDGIDSTGLRVRWALVNSAGTILEQSGGFAMETSIAGFYYVNFGQDITGKGLVTSLANGSFGEVTVNRCGGAGSGCNPAFDNPNHALVRTRNSAGAAPAAASFYVALLP